MGGFGTPSVALATTPTVVSTFFSHILARRSRSRASKKSLQQGGPGGGPEEQLSYEEGIQLVRKFLDFASHHGVEEVQAFTAMTVPTPHWVKRDVVKVPGESINKAADILERHLGTYGVNGKSGGGIDLIGGTRWWKVRGRELEGEWIEKDYLRRTATRPSTVSDPNSSGHRSHRPRHLPRRQDTHASVKDNAGKDVIGDRVILYIHGGAFFFSSLDTHRYQVQRHARKAGARAFCPAYRLSPQYPFPCALLDALASYLYLLYPQPEAHAPILPSSIILMGDSAGAGLCISLLVITREMGLPMPAGASLISPWVDLTHSMPSIGGWDGGDFIPSSGFHYKPSAAWPPLPGDGIEVYQLDGTVKRYDEQIQMYCPNNLLTHPLVSPVNLGSLGGLCPLLILGGGGELLRDEIIYLAHKAADPQTYRPSSRLLTAYPDQAAMIDRYPPTRVHLQIYEGCCHVVPTLSWTRSAKYMYRACANFNIWAFTAAAKSLENQLHRRSSKRRTPNQSRTGTMAAAPLPVVTTWDGDGNPTEEPSPIATATSSTITSSATSELDLTKLDLTKPLINSSSGKAANAEKLDMDDVESEASSDSDEDSGSAEDKEAEPSTGIVTVSGREPQPRDGLIVSERVSTHGKIRPFEPIAGVPALDPNLREHIGQVHPDGAIKKWLAKRAEWDEKYSKELARWRKLKAEDRGLAEKDGFLTRDLQGERPPMASLAGVHSRSLAREIGKSVDEISKKTSGAMLLWYRMSIKADKEHAGGESVEEIKRNVEEEVGSES